MIDTNGDNVDEDTCISVSPKPWDGTILYSQMNELFTYI